MPLNKDDLEVLWDQITPKLYGYLVNVLHDKSLAEDILQTTWLKAIQALPSLKDRSGASFLRGCLLLPEMNVNNIGVKEAERFLLTPRYMTKKQLNQRKKIKFL